MNAQSSKIDYDYNKIDEYLIKKHSLNEDLKQLNILFSSNDCKMCISYLQNILPQAVKLNDLKINIITDNIVYAKKHLKKFNFKFNYVKRQSLFYQPFIFYFRDFNILLIS